ncbi:MAG: amino acid adenylation domain-containing protein [Cyanobacteria bacterium J06623_4]
MIVNTDPKETVQNSIQDLYELSPMQQGMLFHSLYAPGTGIYIEQRHCLIDGDLNRQAFKQAWQQVVNRYDVLRSEFHWEEVDQPLQVVYNTAELPWTETDWRELSPAQQTEKLNAFLTLERTQGFQLDRAPLMTCALFQLSDRTYRFVWSYHHLLMDGWCNGVLIKEVLALYQATCKGQSAQLLSVRPYRDYISWLQQQNNTEAETYWRNALAGFEATTPLGIDRIDHTQITTQRKDSHIHEEKQHFLSEALSDDLQAFAQRSRLTLNTLMQGAWAILLSRYSGLDDLLFGVTVSGRPPTLTGVESMVGLFINTVPLRSQLPHDAPLLPWLQELQQSQRERETYSYSLLTDIQTWSEVPGGSPLFESLLVFENYPVSIEAAAQHLDVGLTLRDGQGYEQTNYPLTLFVIPGDAIQLSLRYDAQRIDSDAATRLLNHLEVILSSFVENAERTLSEVPILTQAEQQQLRAMGEGDRAPISPTCVYQQFEQRVADTPEAIAVLFSPDASDSKTSESKLTYQQLNHKANQVAHYLQSQGVGKGTRVGVCLTRSPEMIVTLLAILKSGGTYIPLDPSHPTERLSYIISDAQIELLVSTCDVAQNLLVKQNTTVLLLDEQSRVIGSQPVKNLSDYTEASDRAYILYTSGSTGKPKGVPILHRNLTNFLGAMAAVTGLTAQDRWLAITTLGFDIAALEIFLPLVSGACVVITPQAVTADGHQLVEKIEAHSITFMQATPATWRLLLNADWQGSSTLHILCGGEALDLSLAQRLLDCGQTVWNLYGPTETTIWSGALKLDDNSLSQGTVPIGGPITNTQFYVLDQQQHQVPVGVSGELYIGGAGLSPGYWNREDLTSERFVQLALPHSHTPPLPYYRTGDRVHYNKNGTLTYLGRLDNQVKLRGYRIELGEIETCLNRYPQVSQAVVTVTKDENPRLIAYLTLSEETTAQQYSETLEANLRQWLNQHLPTYMVPTGYVVLDSFPLTPNGKIDRKSLPTHRSSTTASQPPQTPTQKLVAGIWANILNLPTINLNDNFFELGGHSLLATRVIAQVRQVLSIEVSLRTLFEYSTLSDFVDQIEQNKRSHILPPISPATDLTLSYAQQRQWLIAQLAPDSTAYNIPIAIQITGELSVQALCESIRYIANRHDTLRTVYPSANGTAKPLVLSGQRPALKVTELTQLDKKAQKLAVKAQLKQQIEQSFDLESGPLWRSHLLRLDAHQHILLFTFHHIITDGWSMGILLREITTLYQAQQSEQDIETTLAPLPISYADYAAWQKTLDLSDQLDYWKSQLAGISPLMELPTDFARTAEATGSGASYEFRLSGQETAALKRFSQQHKATLFMTLLAAFKALLYRYSGIRDLVVGTPVANRQRAKLEGLIGLFVNTLVIRTSTEGNPRFRDFLAQIRETTLAAYSHQNLPFEQLVDELDISRSQSHMPLVQVMFSLQNALMKGTTVSDLTWSPLTLEKTTAKFDLSVDVRETEKGLVGRWEYRTDLFSADTIHRMAGHFRSLLKSLPEQGELRLSELSVLSRHELKQLQAWQQGNTAEQLPTESIHQRFEAQAIATPTATAILQGHTQLTYQSLNQKANQLAHYLRESGVGIETCVGVWATRSPEIIIAILAILKAGGVYVPLDPHYPVERLNWMVKDTQMALLLTHTAELSVPLAVQDEVNTVDLSKVTEQIAAFPTNNITHTVGAAISQTSLAYILYTSGSTGQPKGVCIPHQGVTRLVTEPNYVTLTSQDVLLQAAPLTFDASTFEIWGALLNGGTLGLLTSDSPALEDLAAAISTYGVTTLWLTSGLFNLMVDEHLEALKSIRQLLAGGDVLSIPHLKVALRALKETQIINGYGPTEGTTFTCCHPITETDLATSIPIGKPVQHTQVYILDENIQQVPVGIPGELTIGGAGIARGYLNRPDLTAEKFIPNPFFSPSPSHQSRTLSGVEAPTLYRTGDRARHLPDGSIEYLGRLDQQVKIRGFRIELSEVVTALETHPKVKQAIITVRGQSAEKKRLIAYLEPEASFLPGGVPAGGGESQPLALRQFLLERLPDYMVPSRFVWLDELPLTANGKIDRLALPEPWESPTEQAQPLPQTDIEKALTGIWTELLPVQTVGIHDNFFELGGDSILAMQIVSRAGQKGLFISPKNLFQYQTIAELATVAQQGELQPSVSHVSTGDDVPLTPIQQWFFAQELADPAHFNQSVCLALPDGLNREALQQAITHLYSHHDTLRLRFVLTDADWQQRYTENATPTVDWFDFSSLSTEEQDVAIHQQTTRLQSSLNLQHGPLVAVNGFNLGSERSSLLLIVIHHLLVDGVSWRILLSDLQLAYQQAVSNQQIRLAPKTHSYQQWASELRQMAEQMESDRTYWLAIAQTTYPSLPGTESTQENTIGNSHTHTTQLSQAATQSLLQEVPAAYNTQITESLLIAFSQILTQWAEQETALIDLESHGRFSERLDTSRTVGWFTSLYPVALTFEANRSLSENIQAIKSQLRAVPNHGLSYGLLRYTHHQQDLTVTPPISFNYLGQLDKRQLDAHSEMIFQRVPLSSPNQAARNLRTHLIDVNCWIEHETFFTEWTYSANFSQAAIAALAENFVDNLSALINHCCENETTNYTPDDFSLVQLDQNTLSSVLNQVSFTTESVEQEVSP